MKGDKIQQQIVSSPTDLSNKYLKAVDLHSLVILYSNLSNTNLENSLLTGHQTTGDLSKINLRNADLINAYLLNTEMFFFENDQLEMSMRTGRLRRNLSFCRLLS